jgi:hypothetical protein
MGGFPDRPGTPVPDGRWCDGIGVRAASRGGRAWAGQRRQRGIRVGMSIEVTGPDAVGDLRSPHDWLAWELEVAGPAAANGPATG